MFLNLNTRNAPAAADRKGATYYSGAFFSTHNRAFPFYNYNESHLFYLFSFENPLDAIPVIKLAVCAKWQFM